MDLINEILSIKPSGVSKEKLICFVSPTKYLKNRQLLKNKNTINRLKKQISIKIY